ncbi:MAG TPA: thioesterase family protein [Mycobacteriales bacterium]|jgi:Predicted thioesterase
MSRHLHRPTIRFFEADQQRVVYHMWYFAYFEDARNDMLARNGLSLRSLLDRGYDLQVVHFELDLLGAVRWEDELVVGVDVERIGTTSFTLGYEALVNGRRQVTGRVVYVVVSRGAGHKTPIPDELRKVLG